MTRSNSHTHRSVCEPSLASEAIAQCLSFISYLHVLPLPGVPHFVARVLESPELG